MKKQIVLFIALLLFLCSFIQAEKPEDIKLEYFINDYADILTDEQETTIEARLIEIFDSGKAEFAIVTVKNLNGNDIESYSYSVAEGKLGNKETNNGLLLIIAVEDRKYRFEVGRGLEPILNDAKVGRIGRDYLVPAFKQEDYYTGIDLSVKAVADILNNGTEYISNESANYGHNNNTVTITIIFFVVFVIIFIVGVTQSRKLVNGQKTVRSDSDYFAAGALLGALMRGGGGFGGGHGGFGGGGFGGGGAGGSF
jgi:uncharacterized protein